VSTTYAAVEAGGTKFRAAVVDTDLSIIDQAWVPTTTPDETITACEEFFAGHGGVSALGIASFGPLVVNRSSPDYGNVAATPKPDWTGAPLLQRLQRTLGVPADIQTDVEAAAVAEYRMGAGQGHSSVGYVTVGTGIGAALAVDGVPFRQLIRVYTLGFAPDIVLFGGGVGTRPDMAERISRASADDLAGYAVDGPPIVATAGLGADAGLIGAALIAADLHGR